MARKILISLVLAAIMCGCGGAPKISSVSPAEVKAGYPALLEIKGSGFKAGARVTVGGAPVPQAVVAGSSEIVVLLPLDLPAGDASVAIQNPDGQSVQLASAFKVATGLAIVSIDPPTVNEGEQGEVRLSGQGFAPGSKVFFNDRPVTAEVKSDRLIVASPAGVPPGLVTVRVEDPAGGRAELAGAFQVIGADRAQGIQPMTDETDRRQAGAPAQNNRTGVTVANLNNDRFIDLVASGPYGAMLLMGGTDAFKDITAQSGIKSPGITYGVFPADFDNDGLNDLYITGRFGKLFRNLGGGKFEEVNERVKLPTDFVSWSAAWADYDADGFVDLFLGSPLSEDRLFRNRAGQFEEVFADRWQKMEDAKKADNRQASTFSVAFGDLENDGWPDLMVGIRGQNSRFYKNLMGKGLIFSSDEVGLASVVAGIYKVNWGVAWADFTNDGLLDMFWAAGPTGMNLFRNEAGKKFTDVTASMGVQALDSPLCPAWGDFDNDGWQDLALSDNERGLRVLRNLGDGSFRDVSGKVGVARPELATPMAVTWLDANNDGALDLYISGFTSPNRLFINHPYPGRHYLEVELAGGQGNAMAIGTLVIIEVGGQKHIRMVASGSGYLMAPSPVLHFGLDQAASVDKLTVVWPGGQTETREAVAADQTLKLTQPGERKKATLPPPATPAAAPAPGKPAPAPAPPAPAPGKPAPAPAPRKP